MNAKIALLAAAVVIVGSLAAFEVLRRDGGDAATPGPVAPASSSDPAKLSPVAATPPDTTPARSIATTETPRAAAAASAPAKAGPTPIAAAAPRFARGRVLDAEGNALAGLTVAFEHGGPAVRSQSDGSFELELVGASNGQVRVTDPEWTTVLAAVWSGSSKENEALIVAAPLLTLGGTTVDDQGSALGDAEVQFVLPDGFRARFREILDYSAEVGRSARADDDGHFELEVPAVRGALLRATKPRYEPHLGPPPTFSDTALRLVLSTHVAEEQVIRGIVVEPNGAPVSGARVSLSFDTTVTGPDGTFALETRRAGSPNEGLGRYLGIVHDTILAAAPGFLPARRVTDLADADGEPTWPEWILLELGPAPLSLAGRVVDGDGGGRAGIQVWLGDPTLFGMGGDGPVHVETLLSSREDLWAFVETDDAGRFRIDGLVDREYELQAMDPSNLERVVVHGVAAGRHDVVVTLATDRYAEIRGQVLSSAGDPVPNVQVRTVCDAFQLRHAGKVFGTRHAGGPQVVTNQDGRFVLEDVPRDLVYLRLDGESMLPLEYGRAYDGGLGALIADGWATLEITVSMRCHFQLELDPDEPIDEFRVLDAEGASMSIDRFEGNRRSTNESFPVRPGQSETFAVAEGAREIVLVSGGVEVRRASIALRPGELTRVTP